jgi:RHS repeat-associated protein
MYVPTEAEAAIYAQWLTGPIDPIQVLPTQSTTTGFGFVSALPSQPYATIASPVETVYSREIGRKQYELSDHLGNVRYVIGDARMYVNVTTNGGGYDVNTTDQQLAWSDYYPFGMIMRTAENTSDTYRYGFQGQERDDEIKGKGNSLNYKYRMHDARVGRFFAVDPLAPKYPWYTPYQFSGNKVIAYVELEGLEEADGKQESNNNEILPNPFINEKNNQGLSADVSVSPIPGYSAMYNRTLWHNSDRPLGHNTGQTHLKTIALYEQVDC